MKNLGVILVLIGYIVMALAFISSLGFGFYLLAQGVAFGVAGWSAFTLWLKMFFCGLGSLFVGGVLTGII